MKHIVCVAVVLLVFVGYTQAAETPAVVTITEPNSGFRSAVFSPDGTKIVAGAKNKTACVWDATTGQKLLTLQHVDWVHTAIFSPDGKKIATCCYDKIARIWDAESGKELHKLEGHEGMPLVADFSPDGKKVVTVDFIRPHDLIVRLWDAESAKELHLFVGGYPLFSPDGKKIVTIDCDNVDPAIVRIWDVESGKEWLQWGMTGFSGSGTKVAFSPDSKKVITNAGVVVANICDTESGKELQKLEGHFGAIRSVAFSPDGKKVITTSDDESARIWDAETGKELQGLQGNPKAMNQGLRFGGEFDESPLVILQDGEWVLRRTRFDVQFTNAFFSPNGRYVLTVGDNKNNAARIWDAESGKELHKWNVPGYIKILKTPFSPDGKKVVMQAGDNTIRIWTLE